VKGLLSLPSECAVEITARAPSFSINTDFWVLNVGGKIDSLKVKHPISRHLYQTGPLSAEDSFRYLHYAISFPWDSMTPSIERIGSDVEAIVAGDSYLGESLSLKLGNMRVEELLTAARRHS
jgi:hypothetical protein